MRNRSLQGDMVSRLFFRLLPVQVAIVAMGSINSIVDGIVAARCFDAATVGVIGLYYTMIRVMEATGAILLGGVSVLSGRSLGAGDQEKTRGVCSLGVAAALSVGLLLTLVSLLAPNTLASLLGADADLKSDLAAYAKGYAIGIVPQLLAQQLNASLQLERQDKRGQVGVFVMIAMNVALDILFVANMNLGVWGLALATSLANWAYFLVLVSYYAGGKSKLTPNPFRASWKELPEVLKTGFPNALLVFCLAARNLVVNHILLAYAGKDGLSALTAYNLVCGLVLALALGTGAVVRMLTSVFIGEENRDGIITLMRTIITKAMPMGIAMAVAAVFLAPVMSSLFFPDRTSSVYDLTRQLFIINGICIPAAMACLVVTNYCQAIGHRRFVVIASLVDGFFSFVIPAGILAPRLGAFGVWLAFPIGLILTLLLCAAHVLITLRHWPAGWEDCLMLPEDFGKGNRIVLSIDDIGQVTQTAERIQQFCQSQGMSAKTAFHAGLCLEEIAGNIVRHGFGADRTPHRIDVRVVFLAEGVLLRVKDDCIPFNPEEWHDITSPADSCANVGVRLVYGVAKEVEYRNLLGLNVLSITIA